MILNILVIEIILIKLLTNIYVLLRFINKVAWNLLILKNFWIIIWILRIYVIILLIILPNVLLLVECIVTSLIVLEQRLLLGLGLRLGL